MQPLTPTSFVILGIVAAAGEASPYDIKQGIAATVGNFWSIPHSQIYAEPKRLAAAGLLTERREASGRRRLVYAATPAGSEALASWLSEPEAAMPELRDLSLLKLFLGGSPAVIARAQADAHAGRLAEYEAMAAGDPGAEPRGPWLALRAGIRHEREWVAFWEAIAAGEEPAV